jgi:hypothetical protein
MNHACPDCEGAGWSLAEDDDDEHGSHVVPVACEGCDATGQLTECRECREVMPAGELVCSECRKAA